MVGWTGDGTFTRIYSWVADAAAGIDITASRVDADTDNITTNGFNNVLTRDGQGSATGNLPLNGFRFIGAGNAVNPQDFVTLSQMTGGGLNLFATGLTINSTTAVGATFTGTGSGTNLAVTDVTGTIVPGSAASATIVDANGTADIPAGTFLVSQASGTPGGAGIYVTNNPTTPSAAILSIQLGGLVIQNGGASIVGGLVVDTLTLTGLSGSLNVPGGDVSVGGSIVVGQSSTFQENLTVNGAVTTTQINATGGGSAVIQALNGQSQFGTIQVTSSNLVAVTGWALTPTGTGSVSNNFNVGLVVGSGILAGNVFAASDERLKDDVLTVTPGDGKAFVLAAKPYTFTMNGEPGAGFLAQDQARAGYGQYVNTTPNDALEEKIDDDGFKSEKGLQLSLNYNNYLAYLVASNQGLYAENDQLRRQMSAMEARLSALEINR